MIRFTDEQHKLVHENALKVDKMVEEQYALLDGGDLYYNLVQMEVIDINASIRSAAQTVAQHLGQA